MIGIVTVEIRLSCHEISIYCSEKLFEENVLGGPVGFLTPRQGGRRWNIIYIELMNETMNISYRQDMYSPGELGMSHK